MNRIALGLAIGAGYVLGRTKKMKFAIAVGSMVAGKRLNLSPGAVTELVTRQLKDNPQVKELGDELRKDLRGVGKAASGALVERQIAALADRLHDRTADVRGRLSDTVGSTVGGAGAEGEEPADEEEPAGDEDTGRDEDKAPQGGRRSRRDEEGDEDESGGNGGEEEKKKERPARRKPTGSGPAKKTAGKASAAKKAPARKTASAAGRAARAGGRKAGGDTR